MLNTMTNRQMVFILLLSLTSYNVITIPKEMAASAGTGSWLVIFIASVIFGLFAVVITSLGNRFQGRIICEVFGSADFPAGRDGALFYLSGLFPFSGCVSGRYRSQGSSVRIFPENAVLGLSAFQYSCVLLYRQ